jgi:hypothetical protein
LNDKVSNKDDYVNHLMQRLPFSKNRYTQHMLLYCHISTSPMISPCPNKSGEARANLIDFVEITLGASPLL